MKITHAKLKLLYSTFLSSPVNNAITNFYIIASIVYKNYFATFITSYRYSKFDFMLLKLKYNKFLTLEIKNV